MTKQLYSLEVLEEFQKDHYRNFVEVNQFYGTLIDNWIFEFPEGYRFRWYIFEENHLNEWSSAYTLRRTNSVKVVEQFANKYREWAV